MKKTYKIEVDCANCAAKMERAAAKVPGVENVTISFMAQKMIVETPDEGHDQIMQEIVKVCKKVERDCVIYLEK